MLKKGAKRLFISGKELEAELVSKSCIYRTLLRIPALRKDKPGVKFKLCYLISRQATYFHVSSSLPVNKKKKKKEYVIDYKNGPSCSALPILVPFAILFLNALPRDGVRNSPSLYLAT